MKSQFEMPQEIPPAPGAIPQQNLEIAYDANQSPMESDTVAEETQTQEQSIGDGLSQSEVPAENQHETSAENLAEAPAGTGAENRSETGNEVDAEQPAVAESTHEMPKEPIDLETLYNEDIVENPDAELDIMGQLEATEVSLGKVEGSITDMQARVEKKKADLADIRRRLQTPESVPQEIIPEEQQLELLFAQKDALEAKREEAEGLKELQELMDEIGQMTPEVRVYIIQNGVTPEGKPLTTKSGKEVDKDVVKSIATAVENGVKKLTKAVIKVALSIVKGVLKGAFAAVKSMAGGGESSAE